MKTPEDEAFDDLAKRQGAWGGGYQAKREAALDKLVEEQERLGLYDLSQPAQEPVCDKDPQGCWNVRCQLGKQCKNLAQPVQEPVACERCKQLEEQVYDVLGQLKVANLKWSVAHPQPPQRPWVGLKDEEIDALHTSIKVRLMGTFDTKDIYRVVEQALKEKNT